MVFPDFLMVWYPTPCTLTSAFFRVASAEALRRSRPGDCPKKGWNSPGKMVDLTTNIVKWRYHGDITKRSPKTEKCWIYAGK